MTLVYLAIAWATGLLLSHQLREWGVIPCSLPAWFFPLLAGSAGLAIWLSARRKCGRLTSVLVLFLVLAAWRYNEQPMYPCITASSLAYSHEGRATRYATIEGVVTEYPDVRDGRVQYRVRAEFLRFEGRDLKVTGDALVEGPRFPVYAYGDRVRVRGLLQTPPQIEDFDYERYLAQKGIHSLVRYAQVERLAKGQGGRVRGQLYAARARLSSLLNRLLPEPAASLANGMLLGIESGIPDELDEAFKATGASHVIVISGSNIALFSGLLMAWATRVVGRRRAAPLVICVIAAYVLLIGADAAAFRAGVMGSLVVMAACFGRRSTGYVALCAAAIVLTAVNPLTLWDLGFQLSFLATLGLILLARPISSGLQAALNRIGRSPAAQRRLGLVGDSLVLTIAAQIMTAPLLLSSFGRLSLISLPVNALIVPAQPLILMGGFTALAAGMLWEPFGRLVALIPWIPLEYTVAIVRAGAALPFASMSVGERGGMWALLMAAPAVGVIVWRLSRRP